MNRSIARAPGKPRHDPAVCPMDFILRVLMGPWTTYILYNLRNLHSRSPLTCKLVLLRLNDELSGAPQGLSPGDYTVEHILPQKPGRTSAWRSWFPSAEEREVCTNSIGNLVLVTREQNDKARNAELPRKLDIFFRAQGVQVPRITAELEGIAEWRAPQLLAREELVDIGIAARTEKVVATGPVGIEAVVHRVRGDRGHGTQVRQHRPEAVADPHVRAVQLL